MSAKEPSITIEAVAPRTFPDRLGVVARVLNKHSWWADDDRLCECGWRPEVYFDSDDEAQWIAWAEAHAEHQATAVLALLPGPTVEQVRREALTAAADEAKRQAETTRRIGTEARVQLLETEAWLRARAAAPETAR